ncbi:hypothetical protein VSR01_19570 [Actinacidiphila sp. DG2A-62]|uniref:hypothetical protein n=1 Tax=Actinacidiphila sp. DG2A-62 TaxID=3108821 RepID=UPI002DBACDB3|nr:hypothetical protein [Actinacidiphila sp. DG2A-62]MEC3995604.1 hypothetical protein [Actinacidiphila sp. DG2A-62]
MHMTSAPHLLTEDRPDFERVLDEALHLVLGELPLQDEDAAPLNAEQLRTMALAASDVIGATAGEEYEAYRALRAEAREAARESARLRDNRAFGYAAMGVAEGAGSGAGLVAVLAVLTPLLAGAAAVIFLLIGYALQAVSPEPGIASPLRTAGWFFAAVTAASILLGAIGLVLTALRDGSSAIHDTPDAMPPEVARARDAWQDALLDRGMLPFLYEALADAGAAAGRGPGTTGPGRGPAGGRGGGLEEILDGEPLAAAPPSRMPDLGYSRPDFSSPQDPQATAPRFSSPDFSSPDFTTGADRHGDPR